MERFSMSKIREVLRLRFESGLSGRQIAGTLQLARSAVGEYARRFAAAGLGWPLPVSLSDSGSVIEPYRVADLSRAETDNRNSLITC
jgi:predicted transcriptional regulator